jgi:hypothetical protein
LKQLSLPDTLDAGVKPDPDRKKPSLHARISFTFHSEGDREQHYCFRILGHTNAIAFQARMRAAMTASGIDTALKFRHLFILRRGDPPGGPKTKALVDQFLKAGGKFVEPADDELRAFVALRAMAQRDFPGFDVWLRTSKPLFGTPSPSRPGATRREAETGSIEQVPSNMTENELAKNRAEIVSDRDTGAQRNGNAPAAKVTVTRAAIEQPSAPRLIPIGRRFEHGTFGEAITLGADL